MRTGAEAAGWARSQADRSIYWGPGVCLKFARNAYPVDAYNPTAARAWYAAHFKHGTTSTPPTGVPVWWTGGSHGAGHVAPSDGYGYCLSTDILRSGRVNRVPISLIAHAWGLTYRGWTEDINGVRVWHGAVAAAPASKPGVDLSSIVEAFSRDYTRPQGSGLHEVDTYRVERALVSEGLLPTAYGSDGYAGTLSRTAYGSWQRRLGYSGSDANGIPGMTSLTKLGLKHGFRVVA